MEQKKHRLETDSVDYEVIQKKLREIAEQSEDVKSGKITVEDELKEPMYVLYGNILKSTTDILRTEETKKLFDKLIGKFGEDTTADLMEFFAAAITQASYNSVVFYDGLLKQELTREFGKFGDPLNQCIADVKAHSGVLSVFRKRIEALEKVAKVEEIKKGIDDKPAE